MRVIKPLLAVMVLLSATACDMFVMPWHYSAVSDAASQPLTCTAGADCEHKWARALLWVKRKYKAPATQSDTVITTAKSQFGSTDAMITITKVATGGNNYSIEFEGDCDNIFGCIPPIMKQKADFVRFVNG